jgi:hypothetical protein
VLGVRPAAVVVVCLALTGCAHSGGSGPDANVDRLARGFIQTLSEEDVAAFRNAERSDLPMFHFGAGSRVRQLYFGADGEGRKFLCTPRRYCDIDRESMRIVERAWQIIRDAG